MALWEKRGDLVRTLGYGEQRRLEIAISLPSKPKLLLLDEPTSGLTPAECADMIGMVRNLGPDITVIVVAHDMDLVFSLADRIMVLHYGQIIADGTPEEIQDDSSVKEIYMGTE
jgi:branched-chain amino acid transport system ATP-binding protein